MTEAEWLACTDPLVMLEVLRRQATDRKLRLFAGGSVRLSSQWLVHPNSRAAVEASEQVAEGVSRPDILTPMYRAADAESPLLGLLAVARCGSRGHGFCSFAAIPWGRSVD